VRENHPFQNPKTVKLFQEPGPTSRSIYAKISDSGDLVIEAQDVGEAPRNFNPDHDSDYEWFVKVRAENKDLLLLTLIDSLFGGKFSASADFEKWLKEKEIPSEFFSY